LRDPFDLEGRVALVTGASSGLGAGMARALHRAGATVVLVARRAERLTALAAELGERTRVEPADVTAAAAVRRIVDRTAAETGRLDILVNAAGIAKVVPAEEESEADFLNVLGTNLVAVFTACQAAARVMLPAARGSIVNVSSAYGLVGSGRVPQAGYAAAKGGVINLTRELAAQWARRGVRVNALAPGWFPSEMSAPMFEEKGLRFIERTVPMGRPGREHELDGAVVFLASDASSYMTGQALVVDGGLTAV
jgi:NAD(P)-dependent dehydrogenase (short-subunit alcohol dehydrogenase family)